VSSPRGVVLVQTPRLSLRQFTPADAESLVRLDADPQVMHFITGGQPTPRAEIEDVVLPRFLRYHRESPVVGFWAAEDRATGEFLGWFHLRPGGGSPPDEPELGYRLVRHAWGRGLATEGSRALVEVAFTRTDARRVVAETMSVHGASRRVMEKAGLRLVRTFHADWPFPIPGDEEGDVEYAIERADWERSAAPALCGGTRPSTVRSSAEAARRGSGMSEKVTGPRSYFPSIEKSYGEPIDHWMDALETVRGRKHMEQVAWLKSEHGIGHGHANALVAVFRSERGL
jgi:RimJ/RimL family protein N-acetyltransferase